MIRLRNPTTGQTTVGPFTAHPGGVRGVAFNPDGTVLASGGYDNTVRLWSVFDGHPSGRR